MPHIERRATPEEIPPLEPLTEPIGDSGDAPQDPPSSASLPPTFPGTSHTPVPPPAPEEKLDRQMSQAFKFSLVLENKGNVARDHLASERTYLAYVRTSLATASTGVALVQLFSLSSSSGKSMDLSKFARPLGATIIIFALVILVLGVFRYFSTQSALVRGYYPVARNSITAVAFVLGSLVGTVFGVLVAGTRR